MTTTRIRGWLSRPLTPRGAWVGFVIAAIIAAIVILRAYRGLTFFYDEWDFIQDRRGWGLDSFLVAHNEHFVVIPAFIFKVWFVIFGIGSYWPYAVLAVACQIGAASALFMLIRSWASSEAALASATALLFMGSAFEILLWPFELQVTLCLAFGLWALLAIRQQKRFWNIAACVMLVLAVASSSLGLPLLVGAAVLVLMQRPGWRQMWIPAVPLAIYGAWYMKYGHSTTQLGNAKHIPEYASQQAAASLHALLGLPVEFGAPLAVAALVVVGVALCQRWASRVALVPVLAILVVMWVSLALSRYGIAPPDSGRYLYPTAAFMLLAAAAILGRRCLSSITSRAVIVVLLLMSLISNVGSLTLGAAGWRGGSDEVRAALGALNEVHTRLPPDFRPQDHWAPQIRAEKILAAQAALGSAAYSPEQIAVASDAARADADGVLFAAHALSIAPSAAAVGGVAPILKSLERGSRRTEGPSCTTVVAQPKATATAVVDIPASGLRVDAAREPVQVWATRYAVLGPGDPLATAQPGGLPLEIEPTATLVNPPWRAKLSTTGTMTICGLA